MDALSLSVLSVLLLSLALFSAVFLSWVSLLGHVFQLAAPYLPTS